MDMVKCLRCNGNLVRDYSVLRCLFCGRTYSRAHEAVVPEDEPLTDAERVRAFIEAVVDGASEGA